MKNGIENKSAPDPEDAENNEDFELETELTDLLMAEPVPPPRHKITTLPGFLFDGRGADERIDIEGPTEQEQRKIVWETFMPQAVAEVVYGAAEDECRRLITQTFNNAFEVFSLPPYATEDDVKKAFRKLSLIIHPDKCKHPDAPEAFLILTKALEEMERPEAHEQYQAVIDEARKNVKLARAKENKERKKQGQPKLPTDEKSLTTEIRDECKRLVKVVTENLKYAEKTLQANMERELKMEMEREEQEKREREHKRKWAATRDARAYDWKSYRDEAGFSSRRQRPDHKESRRTPQQQQQQQKKRAHFTKASTGLEESYKSRWR